MCIGAPRAATTWLHEALSADERIFLPKRKELHFYDERPPQVAEEDSEFRWRRTTFFDVESPAHLRWYWYQYRAARSELRGDITPVYSLLSADRVRIVRTHVPDLKIIYILRNPIDRAWSGLRKTVWYQKGKARLDSLDEQWLCATVMRPEVLARGNYQCAIETWEAVYPEEQICYLFYDDIVTDPDSVLRRVYEFLGLARHPELSASSRSRKVNAAPSKEMPATVRARLEKYYTPQIKFLEKRFARDLSHWRTAQKKTRV